jgi:hypothetical protein
MVIASCGLAMIIPRKHYEFIPFWGGLGLSSFLPNSESSAMIIKFTQTTLFHILSRLPTPEKTTNLTEKTDFFIISRLFALNFLYLML